ncbi:hypothetical protein [Actinoplanes teichomyceticus]|uniref:Uncharacterized protein n=1 Tax=Actinoplanes teichomyceticus TaxID=1867 RepID=A0A561WIM4_ACTTI|nr:hypothetical protein [Actinoplanes teichomyceticus]TWG23722.1 hypothetical protein FHX34_102273 [Actinoplanes teichomyceticus]GIF11763.1 hypothetical protein Ate01nite_17950 [Actinoplanes teichomyceticus]
MDDGVDMPYRVVGALFGPESGIPWWAWLAPLILIFAKLLYPVMFPLAAAAEAETDRRLAEFRRERNGKNRDNAAGKGKKGKK